jgi:hypothetical protein
MRFLQQASCTAGTLTPLILPLRARLAVGGPTAFSDLAGNLAYDRPVES